MKLVKLVSIIVLFSIQSLVCIPELDQVFKTDVTTQFGFPFDLCWHTFNGERLLIVGGNFFENDDAAEVLRLFRLSFSPTPILTEIYKVPSSVLIAGEHGFLYNFSCPVTTVSGIDYFGVVGDFFNTGTSGDECLRLFKFDTNPYTGSTILTEVSKVPTSVINGRGIGISATMINGIAYFAVGGEFFENPYSSSGFEALRLFKLDDSLSTPELIEVYRVPLTTLFGEADRLQWQQIGDEFYLAVGGIFFDNAGSGNEVLRLYKFEELVYGNPQLTEISKVPTSIIDGSINGTSVTTLDWATINGSYYLSVGGHFINNGPSGSEPVRLFRFDDSYVTPQLIQVYKIPMPPLPQFVPEMFIFNFVGTAWVEADNAFYLAVADHFFDPYGTEGGSQKLRLYQYVEISGEPTLQEVFKVSQSIIDGEVFALAWQQIGKFFLLATGGFPFTFGSGSMLLGGGMQLELDPYNNITAQFATNPGNENLRLFFLDLGNFVATSKLAYQVTTNATSTCGINVQ